jgi:hypothetical protein
MISLFKNIIYCSAWERNIFGSEVYFTVFQKKLFCRKTAEGAAFSERLVGVRTRIK